MRDPNRLKHLQYIPECTRLPLRKTLPEDWVTPKRKYSGASVLIANSFWNRRQILKLSRTKKTSCNLPHDPLFLSEKISESGGSWCQQVLPCTSTSREKNECRDKILISKCIKYRMHFEAVECQVPLYFLLSAPSFIFWWWGIWKVFLYTIWYSGWSVGFQVLIYKRAL